MFATKTDNGSKMMKVQALLAFNQVSLKRINSYNLPPHLIRVKGGTNIHTSTHLLNSDWLTFGN
jgi:hypothetical protein